MAIVKMSKFNLFIFESERDNLLQELQKFEYVHFHQLDEEEELIEEGLEAVSIPESITEVEEEISKVKYGIDLLSQYDPREGGIKALIKGKENLTFEELEEKAQKFDYYPIYKKLKDLMVQIENYDQEAVKLRALKEEFEPWKRLDYPIEDLKIFKQCEVYTGIIPLKMKDNFTQDLLDLEYTYTEIVGEDSKNIYIFALSLKEESSKFGEILRRNGYTSIRLDGKGNPKEELNRVDERLKLLEEEKSRVTDEIKELAKELPNLEIYYEYLMNKKLRLTVSENFLTTGRVNLIEGYVPTEKTEEFVKIVEKSQKNVYYLEIEEAEKDDPNVPILLKNSRFVETFESLTAMFAMPKYDEIDPTPLLAPFYFLFFGMMVADAGYGLVVVIGAYIALKVANLSEEQEKFIRFFYYLGYATIFWGIFFGSYFGGIIPIPGFMDPAAEYQKLLVMSIVFGIVHMYYALGIKAYMNIRDKQYLDALYDVGFWYMTLTGGIVLLLTMFMSLPDVVLKVAKISLIIGAIGIVLTNGRSAQSVGGKIAGGLYELYGISGYIGDFVSYSRLMALGLSGGFIASTINLMIDMLLDLGIIGIIIAIVVFVGGQLFNVFLSLLSAYVHAIRLTYVEFFGKFYEGGGIEFNTFRSDPKYINLK